MYAEAEALALTMTRDYPKDGFAWKALGIIFRNTGKLTEAVEANQKAVDLLSKDAEAHTNLGVTLKAIGNLDAALLSHKRALEIQPDFVDAHNNMGSVYRALKKNVKAVNCFEKAISLNPKSASAHANLGVTFQELGRLSSAEACYKKAIKLNPNYAVAYYNFGTLLKERGQLDGAKACYKKAISINPEYYDALHALGRVLEELSLYKEAVSVFRQALQVDDSRTFSHDQILTCLFNTNERHEFINELDNFLANGRISATAGSLISRAFIKYEIKKQNPFCQNPLSYVLHKNLLDIYDFDNTFVQSTRYLLKSDQQFRRQTLIVGGQQTFGNIFDFDDSRLRQIEKIIRSEISNYLLHYASSEEGFLRRWPKEYNLNGWLISLKNGGELLPHIHERGWLSGSIYIKVPQNLPDNDGNLVVSLGNENDSSTSVLNKANTINVRTGSMVLFPASLMHHTIPFESEEDRIVLAFDVVPRF